MKKVVLMAAVLVTFVGVNAANAGLAAHWTLDSLAEGTPYGDPAPAVVAGVDDMALDFNLANYVDLGNDPALSMGTGNLSITAWVKFGYLPPSQLPDGTPLPGHGIIAGKGIMSNDNGYGLIALDTGQVCFQVREGNIAYREVYSNDTGGNWVGFVNDEQWHHVVGVLEREQVNGTRIYVDGVLQSHSYDVAVSTIGFTNDLDSAAPLCVGARYSDTMPEGQKALWFLDGSVDDVQVYDYVLTQDDIDFLVANPGVAIPEPTLLALLGFGAAGLLRRNRRG